MRGTKGRMALGPILVAGALALAGCGAGAGVPAAGTPPSASTQGTANAPCTLPALPTAGSAPGDGFPGEAMTGPAVAALQGGAARAAFSLDGGDLRVQPPAPGQRPTISALQAECDALAAVGSHGGALYGAAEASGAAVGYGRVTVAPAVIARSSAPPNYGVDAVNGTSSQARLPAPAAYGARLAWIVVVQQRVVAPCPFLPASPGGAGASSARPAGPSSFDYEVFLVDARTGGDALLYTEAQPEPCGGTGSIPPSAIVPVDQASVPWRLVSRAPDGYAGEISATVLPCEAYPGVVNVDGNRPAVGVVALSPVDPSCGTARQVTIALHAATVTSNLPAQIAHDPVGLYIPGPQTASNASAAPSGARLENLGPSDAGATLTVPVGTVLVVTPFPGVREPGPNPATSSDPSVLGALDGQAGPVAEFRAWRSGTADLTIPTTACATPPTKAPPCTGPWVVHVRVS